MKPWGEINLPTKEFTYVIDLWTWTVCCFVKERNEKRDDILTSAPESPPSFAGELSEESAVSDKSGAPASTLMTLSLPPFNY